MLSHIQPRSSVEMKFTDLAFTVPLGFRKGTKTLINNLNGHIRPGELTAIIGPSGAGKTTLLNVLSGYKVIGTSGSVLVNGKTRDIKQFRKLSCYIMRDDLLHPHLSVFESINIAASLKLGRNVSHQEKMRLTTDVLDALKLTGSLKTRCNMLSSGERKRLCIALELLTNPPIMFFDEATSGLDSSTSFDCISILKSLTADGRTIVCSIHQPSAMLFELFDRLFVMGGGQFIYRGLTSGLEAYLASIGFLCKQHHNPADYAIELASGCHGHVLQKLFNYVHFGECNKWDTDMIDRKQNVTNIDEEFGDERMEGTALLSSQTHSEEANPVIVKVVESDEEYCRISNMEQFHILLKRSFICIWRDKMLTAARFISHIVVALLVGLMYKDIGDEASKFQSNAGFILLSLMFLTFTAVLITAVTFPLEMSILIRENLNSWYKLTVFYWARTLADLPFQVILPLTYTTIAYFMSGQPTDFSRFLYFNIIAIESSLVAETIGLAAGAIFDVQISGYLAAVFCIPPYVFSGFFIRIADMPSYLRWITYGSYMYYSIEGIFLSLYGVVAGKSRERLNCSQKFCFYRNPETILTDGIEGQLDYWTCVGALFGIIIVLRVLTYAIFIVRMKSDK